MPDKEELKISVIIPTLNGAERLDDLFASLKGQSLLPDEILVIDSGSRDATLSIARSHDVRIITLSPDAFDHGGTRTLAGREALGNILVYLTQDAVPDDDRALEQLVAPFADARIAATYGRQLPHADATPAARHLRAFNYPVQDSVRCWEDRQTYGFKTAFISNSFAAYRKDLLAQVDFFITGMLFGEDTFTLAKLLRRGYCVAYAAEARVRHSHNYTLGREFKRYFDIGVVHARHRELIASFGTPSAEGRRYVRSELSYLFREGYFLSLPGSIARSGAKYIAYQLGKRFTLLPRGLAMRLSLNKRWWQVNLSKGT